MRSTVARREHSSAGPEAVAPPERITWPDAAARRASFLRHRKKRGASWTRTRSGSQALITRASAAVSSRIERML